MKRELLYFIIKIVFIVGGFLLGFLLGSKLIENL